MSKALLTMDLSHNNLIFDESTPQIIAKLTCEPCLGLPTHDAQSPAACSAFGPLLYPMPGHVCSGCNQGEITRLVILTAAVGGGGVLLFSLLSCLLLYYPDALIRGVSTVTIIVNHVQSVTAISGLQLEGPLLLTDLRAFLTLHVPSLSDAICLLRTAEAMERAQWLVALGYNTTVVVLLVALLCLQWAFRRCGKQQRADQAEQVLSVLYLLQLTTTWLLCLRTFRDYKLADTSGTVRSKQAHTGPKGPTRVHGA